MGARCARPLLVGGARPVALSPSSQHSKKNPNRTCGPCLSYWPHLSLHLCRWVMGGGQLAPHSFVRSHQKMLPSPSKQSRCAAFSRASLPRPVSRPFPPSRGGVKRASSPSASTSASLQVDDDGISTTVPSSAQTSWLRTMWDFRCAFAFILEKKYFRKFDD